MPKRNTETETEPIYRVKPFRLTLNFPVGDHLERGATVTIKCPYCRREHIHGFGTGYRVPHCFDDRGDYWLDCDKFQGEVVIRNKKTRAPRGLTEWPPKAI